MQSKQSVTKFNSLAYTALQLPDYSIWLSCIFLSALSLVLTLYLPSVGEEAVYTNISLEMLHDHEYLVPKLFGEHYSRPPLFNWLMLGVVKFVGPQQMLLAARIVNLSATIFSGICLFWFAKKILATSTNALLCVALYFSGDLLFKRGWIAYADSLFSLFIFASIVCLWLALQRQQNRWLIFANLALCAGFLAKIHTVYVFYGLSLLVMLWFMPNKRFVFNLNSILLHLCGLIFPLIWTYKVNHGYGGLATTWLQSQPFLHWPGFLPFITRVALIFPADLIMRLCPASLLAMFAWFKMPALRTKLKDDRNFNIIFWITLLNLLPYWLAPNSNTRYLLPLYPFMAILLANVISNSTAKVRNLTMLSLLITILIKYIVTVWWLPYETKVYRGDALAIAQDIYKRTQGANLYTNDSSSGGLRVAYELNKLRYPAAPLKMSDNLYCGYSLNDRYSNHFGEIIETYTLRKEKLFLMFSTSTC